MSEHSELSANLPGFLRAGLGSEIKAVNVEKREVLHRITSINPDRVGDRVVPRGAVLDQFKRHPVVLLDHDYRAEKIVGKAVHLDIKKDEIIARTRYLDTPLGQDAFNLVREGLGAYSIGFKPIDIEPIEDESRKDITGFWIKEWELLEYSQVAIPMNPDAVTLAVQKGLIRKENVARLVCAPAPAEEETPPADTQRADVGAIMRRLSRRLSTENDAADVVRLATRD